MKNACIAGVFLHPDRRKTAAFPLSHDSHPSPLPDTLFLPRTNRHRYRPQLRMLSCTNLPTANRKRQPSGKKAARGIAIRNTSRRQSRSQSPVLTAVCPPPDTVISPNRPFRQRTDIFCMDAREYGQEKHADRRNGGKNRGYGSMQTVTEPFITGCSGSVQMTVPFREWLTPENGTRIAGGSERRKKCLVPARSCPMLFCPFVQHMRYFPDCKGKMTLADRLVHRKRG